MKILSFLFFSCIFALIYGILIWEKMFKTMLIVGAGGFIGSCCRYLLGKWVHHIFSLPFPWGTFIVNIIGSFLIGIFFGMAEKMHLFSAQVSVFLITGFCGGFTTFSSFSNEMFLLMQNKQWGYFTVYLVASVVLGILSVWLGRSVVKPV